MPYENILLEREGPVATITVNRPKSLNALNSATLRELTQAVREAADSCRAPGTAPSSRVRTSPRWRR